MQRASEIHLQLKLAENNHEFIKTGFKKLDDSLHGGLLKQELVIIGGNSGIGKSYLAGQIFFNIAKQGFNSAYFSLEITNKMVYSRLVGAESNIMPTRIQFGLLDKTEFESRQQAEAEITAYDSFMAFYDDIYHYKNLIEEVKKNKFEFIVIDFLGNLENGMPDEYQRTTKLAKDLQQIAKELNICVLLLSQQSNVASREGAETKSLEYKGSGSIKHACDLGFIIEREKYVEGTSFQNIKLVLKKNRRGISDLVFPMIFKMPGGKFYESNS